MHAAIRRGIVFLLICQGLAYAASPNPVPANLSEEAQAYLARTPLGNLPEPATQNIDRLKKTRAGLDRMFMGFALAIDPDFYTTRQDINGVPVYWVNSELPDKPGPVIIYLHGGGHLVGSAEAGAATGIRIKGAAGIPVISVEYRLAPEHPYPADIEDIMQVYIGLLEFGYQADQIAVYGDSAGGALSLALALEARNRNLPMPAAVAVMSPMADVKHLGDTRITLVDFDPVLRQPLANRYQMYVGDADPADPLLSPVYADYSDFPPLMIQVGTRERLLSDSVRLARKARKDGADVRLDVWDGMWHGWQAMPNLPEAEEACEELAIFLAHHLAD